MAGGPVMQLDDESGGPCPMLETWVGQLAPGIDNLYRDINYVVNYNV